MRAKSDRKQQTTVDSVKFTTGEFMQLGHAGGIHGIYGIHHVTDSFYLLWLLVAPNMSVLFRVKGDIATRLCQCDTVRHKRSSPAPSGNGTAVCCTNGTANPAWRP